MNEIIRPTDWFGHKTQPAQKVEIPTNAARAEALKALDKDSLNLGDINPLIHPLDLFNRQSVDALKYTTLDKIRKYKGLLPVSLESTAVFDPATGSSDYRFIARFEVQDLSARKMNLLEKLVKETYEPGAVNTRKDEKGNDIKPGSYPPIQLGAESESKITGWCMGPNTAPVTSHHIGLYVYRDLGKIDKNNFFDRNLATRKFIVEIREANQYQTDLSTFIIQTSAILSRSKLLPRGDLLYETYYDLIRLGLKKVNDQSIYGMEGAIDSIKRGLLLPLASPDLSHGIKEDPQSVLMVGVPGTGKTLTVEELLQEETGVFILPIDPLELHKELRQDKQKQKLLQRIADVKRISQKPVVLHIDDIENMVDGDDATHSTLLNLMAGVRESGFYVISSTNKPNKIDPALIQPQRFGILIHCGLQNEEARFEMLKIHANLLSVRQNRPLFSSPEIRDLILKEIARITEDFTPRYLYDIANSAKNFLAERIAKIKQTTIGLTESDLEGNTFSIDDWEKAFIEVSSMYDSEAVKQADHELREFVDKHKKGSIGFRVDGAQRVIFSKDILRQVATLEAELQQGATLNFNSSQESK